MALLDTVLFDEYRERLRQLLIERAYEKRQVVLASGAQSGYYFDCKQASLSGEGHFLIGQLFGHMMTQIEADEKTTHLACAGMSIGADPLCSSLSLTCHLNQRTLDAVYVRKEAKTHGTASYLEGTKLLPPNAPILLLEDVITTGGSTLTAFEHVKAGGFEVKHVLALIDRDAGGAENLAKAGLSFHPIFHLRDFQ